RCGASAVIGEHESRPAVPSAATPPACLGIPAVRTLPKACRFFRGRPAVVFLTVRTEAHTSWLAHADALAPVTHAWSQAEGWLVGDFLLMPDHLHCFCSPTDERFSIEQWIAYWKRLCRKTHGRAEWRFQSRGWHHRLRQEESYAEKWDYVRANP